MVIKVGTKDDRADDIGRSTAEQEAGVKGLPWKCKKTHLTTSSIMPITIAIVIEVAGDRAAHLAPSMI